LDVGRRRCAAGDELVRLRKGLGVVAGLAVVAARVREVDPLAPVDPLDPTGLPSALAAVHTALTELATSLEQTHFVHGAPQRAIAGTPGWYA
jgi:hypothetical protein